VPIDDQPISVCLESGETHSTDARTRCSIGLGMLRSAKAVLVIVAALSAAGCARSTGASEHRSKLGHFPELTTDSLPEQTSDALLTVLNDAVEGGLPGIAATVLAADRGIWSGASGTANGVDPVVIESQFGIGSITKTLVAAEVLSLKERGVLDLGEQASEHLPARLDFDTNHATIDDLLAMRSGIPDPTILDGPLMEIDPTRTWDVSEILASVPTSRSPANRSFAYSSTNFILLGVMIEELLGSSVAATLRADVLQGREFSTMAYQPEERPSGPVALPFMFGQVRPDIIEVGGGYLPTKASASAGSAAGCMTSDSSALARWAYRLFGGGVLSQQSLNLMADFGDDGYGRGVFDLSDFGTDFGVPVIGNGGWDPGGYSATLVVLPTEGTVITVLTNTGGDPANLVLPIAERLSAVLGA
jgi:D-alanyl-D-alanine carboxypeptidase